LGISQRGLVRSADTTKCELPHQPEFSTRRKSYPVPVDRLSHSRADAKNNTDGGRQSSYEPKFVLIAKKMCALGATKADLAEAFDVSISTIAAWQVTHRKFSESCKVGTECCNDRVERSLYEKGSWLRISR
jgi:hypothetical protein